MLKLKPRILALSTVSLLASCSASQPPLIVKETLPDAPANFGKPVALPAPKINESVKVFALRNRQAVTEANMRLNNDSAFYKDVKKEFSQ